MIPSSTKNITNPKIIKHTIILMIFLSLYLMYLIIKNTNTTKDKIKYGIAPKKR